MALEAVAFSHIWSDTDAFIYCSHGKRYSSMRTRQNKIHYGLKVRFSYPVEVSQALLSGSPTSAADLCSRAETIFNICACLRDVD